MSKFSRPIEMAPRYLNQPILPGWQFSLFQIDLGESGDPGMEDRMIEDVGSYGRQIGHVAEALEAVLHKLGLDQSDQRNADPDLSPEQRKAIEVFLDDAAAVRTIKRNRKKAVA